MNVKTVENFFGTDGVRGKAGVRPMDAETMLRLGLAYGKWLLARNPVNQNPFVILGRDTRESGEMIAQALGAGLMSLGIDLVDLGVQPTPAVAIAVRACEAVGGIVISASHNPFYDNGVKFFKEDGFKLKDEEEEAISLEMAALSDFLPNRFGRLLPDSDHGIAYRDFILQNALSGEDLKGLKIVLDTANGAMYRVAPEIFKALGADIHVIADEPNGRNINAGVGSQHVEKLAEAVLAWKADLGLAFDGDGDRLIAVDAKGQKVRGDCLLAIFGKAAKEKGVLGKNPVVVSTVMSNFGLKEFFASEGIRYEASGVGDRQVLELMEQTGALIGGEDSGHFIFLDSHCTGDGLYAGLRLAALCKKTPLEDLASILRFYPQILINVPMEKKTPMEELPEVWARIQEAERELGDSGRVLIRYSGTEPLCRVMVEAPLEELARKHAEGIASALKKTAQRLA